LEGAFTAFFIALEVQSRTHIQIDVGHGFEIDLSRLHPTVLLRMAGKTLEHDPDDVKIFQEVM
jgi:hypothetical protein